MMHPGKVAVTLDEQTLTYEELLAQVQRLAYFLINSQGVQPGDIICQCVHRSIEMIVGILGILMSGAIYVPLIPTDPIDRLQSLIHQVDAKLVLVNQNSPSHLNRFDVPIVDISEILDCPVRLNDAQIEQLSQVVVTPQSISHIVFTSGSTGLPKAVQLRHRNLLANIKTHIIEENDVVLQLSSSSFDSHLDDIGGALLQGGHLVLLKAGGHLDFDYMTKVIYEKNVTYVGPVPSWIGALSEFLSENYHAQERVRQVHWWYLGGEQLLSSTVSQLLPFISEESRIFNLYGPAEATVVTTCYEINRKDLSTIISLPIGRPLQGYRIYLLDDYRQPVVPGKEGEIIIGGVGVFAGYYGRMDLTRQVLIEMDGEQFYMTGDLGRLDVELNGLVFVGRRDFQIKLRGQRIELREIEETVLKGLSSVSGCVVIKCIHQGEEHLIAYVETLSNTVKESDVRDLCHSLLPSYMVPTMFIILERFPLTKNGKIDRKTLPEPKFASLMESSSEYNKPLTEMEKRVHDLWCQVLRITHISRTTSFFSVYGTSLAFMKLYNLYQIEFGVTPDIVACFQHASIAEHTRLLNESVASIVSKHYRAWSCLHLDQDEISFAQARIFIDEQIRFHSSDDNTIAIYNIPLIYRLSEGTISIKRLQRALRNITRKHAVLRTCLRMDPVHGNLIQYIQSNDKQDWFTFSKDIIQDDNMLATIFMNEWTNRSHFDLSQGRVSRCHILHYQRRSEKDDDNLLSIGDWIIFNFHHVAFDGESEQIFFNDLRNFYIDEQEQAVEDSEAALQYIDCEFF
ncbi:unnamed protein product [Adineta steineri]|uniref:Carrier domain-containing protein n=1 Tax=Adineta steineri TaxID=433720 RepID=A0A814DEA1_9BILA|nr:unnamed protein product [Adineta steineri]CAF1441533.1 unnamed protein product [Adineta steineri]CAF1442619.1 unnamed protein product [Adineta steineri]